MGNAHRSNDPATTGNAAAVVQAAIKEHPVVVFSKSYCPYCKSAKRDIASAGKQVADFQPAKVFELDTMGADGSAIQSYLARTTGRSTVPNVFIGGKPIGGGDDIAGYARRGVLKQMLAQAGAQLAAADGGKAQELVEETIDNYPIVVFSKTTCPYCKAAKAALNDVATRVDKFDGPHVVEVDTMGELGVQIRAYLTEKTGRRTVPNVFFNGKPIGGGDEIRALAATGELDAMVASAIGVEAPSEVKTPEDIVEEAIAGNAIAIFSKSYCPYCIRAKGLIAQTGKTIEGFQTPKIFELDQIAEGPAMQQYLLTKTGQRTVPNIFIGGKHIGGSSDLGAVAGRNELVDLIKEAQNSLSAASESTAVADETASEETAPEKTTTEESSALPAAVAGATNVTTATLTTSSTPDIKEIVFGAGCFWGVELAFQRVVGVVKTEVGYSNGKIERVTYDSVCSGLTGAAEVVRVWYDPKIVSLTKLLEVWEGRHDPTSMNKQGNDVGTQYRSAVFYNDQEQADEVTKWSAEATQRLGRPIVTDVAAVKNYCSAEEYHQRYLEKKGQTAEKGSTAAIRCYG